MSFMFRYRVQGGHTWVRVFAGPDADHRAKLGDLAFRNDEWLAFRTNLLWVGSRNGIHCEVVEDDAAVELARS